jgi:hypothetical protein
MIYLEAFSAVRQLQDVHLVLDERPEFCIINSGPV